ncbi:asparagine synthase C-terminal domain-containing protein [Kiloniella sp. EL199]|uniref:asparagine synthase C-terminal domain-containing protein n=1 Tax=Kiloniella sp. EL199 TaxID=2107581 RepID=UPI000EA180DB|nr:asparagine synthase C-terminal domain-containing protein [Kiloniella sp. EL199]
MPNIMGYTSIYLAESFGWSHHDNNSSQLFFKGHLHNTAYKSKNFLAQLMDHFDQISEQSNLAKIIDQLDGHFALIYQRKDLTVASVDRVRSIPLLYAKSDEDKWVISDHAAPILKHLKLASDDISKNAALEIAVSGFCIGTKTLYQNITGFLPGEYITISPKEEVLRFKYHQFSPWKGEQNRGEIQDYKHTLLSQTLKVLQKTIDSAKGRKILVPLSAGMDSRVIISGFKELGFSNLECFSYGRKGNHESYTAKKIADKLGYNWHFLPTTTANFRQIRNTKSYQEYLKKSDSLISTPVEQDVVTLHMMKDCDWARNGIVVNGQTGDFISGNHIPKALQTPSDLGSTQEAKNQLFSSIFSKHFGLWPSLFEKLEKQDFIKQINAELIEANAPDLTKENAYSLYEYYEFVNRQAKYVLGNQRGYEHYGFGWRLPLWDSEFIEFWESVPLEYKVNQNLYKNSMIEANWGGVWNSLLPAPTWVTPSYIRPLRFLGKAFCSPFGKPAWHRFENRFFAHSMDSLRKYAAVSWWDVASTSRPHRNAISWLTSLYLKSHNLNWDGSPKN